MATSFEELRSCGPRARQATRARGTAPGLWERFLEPLFPNSQAQRSVGWLARSSGELLAWCSSCFFLVFQTSAGAKDKRGEESPLRLQRLSELGQGLESRASWGGRRLAAGVWGLGRAGGLEGISAMREP